MALKNMDAIGHRTSLFIFAALVVFLTATTTQAGFEWVPGTDKTPAATEDEQPAADAVGAEAPADITEEVFIPEPAMESEPLAPQPISDEKDLAMPAAPQPEPQPVIVLDAPQQPSRLKVLTPGQEQKIQDAATAAQPPATPAPEAAYIPGEAPKALIAPEQPRAPLVIPATVDAAPKRPQPQQDNAALAPPPEMPAELKVIMPEDAPDSAMTMPGAERMLINPNPLPTQPAAAAPQQQAPAQQIAAPGSYAPAEGFGSDMPLVMALQQIVPADYAFSFGTDVNPGSHVSWTGGKPWNEVVSEMAASLNLQAQIRGKVVHISKATPTTAPGKSAALEPAQPEAAPTAEPEHAPLDLTEAIPTVAPVSTGRSTIKDPGNAPAAQPAATMSRIQSIETSASAASEMPSAATIEPASGQQDAQPQEMPAAAASILAETPAAAAPKGWMARSGDSLKDTLQAWSAQAGVELLWQPSHDYTISVDIATDSSFENAVKTVFANALQDAGKPSVVFLNDTKTEELRAVMVQEEKAADAAAPAAPSPTAG